MPSELLARLRAANISCADFLARGEAAVAAPAAGSAAGEGEIAGLFARIEAVGRLLPPGGARSAAAAAEPELAWELMTYDRLLRQMQLSLERLHQELLRRRDEMTHSRRHLLAASAWASATLQTAG